MGTLTQLRATVAGFHATSTGSFTVGGFDLFLGSVNNAIKTAQMLQDFEDSRCTALLNIDAVVGGNLVNAVFEVGASTTMVVTGTLSPNVVGTYLQTGLYGGFPLFTLEGTPTYFLYFNVTLGSYILSNTLTDGTPTAYFIPSPIQTSAPGTYVNAGTATGTATVAQTLVNAFSAIKTVLAVTRQRPDGTYIPLDFARADIPIERDRTELEFSDNLFPYLRYPSDAQINARGTNSSIIQRGQNLSIYPVYTAGVTVPFTVRLECFGWLNALRSGNYADTFPSNSLLDYGFEWLQWSAICELNYIFKTFVPRTEGNLSAPEKYRDDAWNKPVLFDAYRVDANTTRSR